MAEEVPRHELGREALMVWVDAMRKRFQASLDVWNGKPFGRGLDSEKDMRISGYLLG